MKFIGLDLIRCVAIVLLLLAHISQAINNPFGSFDIPHFYHVSLGGGAVTIYLILSGIVLFGAACGDGCLGGALQRGGIGPG
jgi:peptidoglycan/LPS O-acetylase OafA/YrhL